MIRRELARPDVAGASWILISQVDHARLSGQLAEHWGAGEVVPLVARDELLWAITHHDDGWSEWEQTPGVEADTGRPRSFTEMDVADGLEIWSRSITGAAEHGALAGYVVAGHFCALLRRFDAAWKNKPMETQLAERFLATYDNLRDGCLQAWLSHSGDHTRDLAERALLQLQLFDALSLWFCCSECPQPEEFTTPGGATVRFEMADPASQGEPQRVVVRHWPLAVEGLNLEIAGRAVPVRRYRGQADLAAAPSQSVQLGWRLEPGRPKS